MIIKLKKKPIFKEKTSSKEKNNSELQQRIEKNWQKFIKENEEFFNGNIYSVTDIKNDLEQYIFEIEKAKFADLIYAKQNTELMIHSLFVSIFIQTKDNYYVLIRNNHGTINSIGGMASDEDKENNTFSPEKCLEREIKEEIGLSLNDKKDFLEYDLNYLKIPNQPINVYSCGIIYTGIINYTKEELEKYFIENKNKLDKEVSELLFYSKDSYKDLYNENNKKDYLIEVLEDIIKR